MITSLRLRDFKNFADGTLRAGPFTVIVGANASGKSNIRDAFRFLHGVGRGYALAEIVEGKPGAGGQPEWEPIRGTNDELIRLDKSRAGPPSPNPAFGLAIEFALEGETAAYLIEIGREVGGSGFRIARELLRIGGKTIYEKPRDNSGKDKAVIGTEATIDVHVDRPALAQILESRRLPRHDKERVRSAVDVLANMRFPEFSPARMREPAVSGRTRLGDRGENLPAVLEGICADPGRKATLMEWIRELTPMDVRDLGFSADPSGRVHLAILEENGRSISACSVSDGALRFLAMLAVLLGAAPPRLCFFEGIDRGLHPSRLHLLVDLIERQTAMSGVQVITTTHSPELLSWVNDETFENISVLCRPEDADDAIIRRVADLHNAGRLRKTQGLGRLLAGGWMETAIAFTEGDENGRDAAQRVPVAP